MKTNELEWDEVKEGEIKQMSLISDLCLANVIEGVGVALDI